MFTLDTDGLLNDLEKAVQEGLQEKIAEINADILSLTCPEHGTHPTVAPIPEGEDQYNFNMCCDKLKVLVEQRIAEYQ